MWVSVRSGLTVGCILLPTTTDNQSLSTSYLVLPFQSANSVLSKRIALNKFP